MISYYVNKDALKTLFYILCFLGLILGLIVGSFMDHPHSTKNKGEKTAQVVNDSSAEELVKNEETIEGDPAAVEEYSLKGCLTDGKKKYEIEMFLYICLDGDEAGGEYRYMSKPEDAVIGLSGSYELEPTGGTGDYAYSKHIKLESEDKKELFAFEIHPAYQEVEGEWFLFNSPADASIGKVAKKLDVQLIW